MPRILLEHGAMFGPNGLGVNEQILLDNAVAVPVDFLWLETPAGLGQAVEFRSVAVCLSRSQRLRFKERASTHGIHDRGQLSNRKYSVGLARGESRGASGPSHQNGRVDVELKSRNGVPYDFSQNTRFMSDGIDRRPAARAIVDQPHVAIAGKDPVPILDLQQKDPIIHYDQRVDVQRPVARRQILERRVQEPIIGKCGGKRRKRRSFARMYSRAVQISNTTAHPAPLPVSALARLSLVLNNTQGFQPEP
ncbi:hypothetical protein CQ14_21325 [Bradyrhizobium lablabi]|uniref:Uncharacterized protein n=1 Tax=Bradyrhizobium lablabi TaxID=722472 RepID=A0A0R3N247_9BRAD|nr:hypothetical protein CQ14_21325 [Bradyrhizobium lablabi]